MLGLAMRAMVIAAALLRTSHVAPRWLELAEFTGDVVANALCGLGALALAQWHTGVRRAHPARGTGLAELRRGGVQRARRVAADLAAVAGSGRWARIESYLWFAIAVLPRPGSHSPPPAGTACSRSPQSW